ncbi:hypothetical protein GEMRC1_011820 [Eukaryota sp. GEM-RC1]
MIFSKNTKILSESITITLHSSELYSDDSVDISKPELKLISINSWSQIDFSNFHSLDLSFSTFKSSPDRTVFVNYFTCFHCQILGNSSLSIVLDFAIASGNLSSSLIVQRSAKSLFTGEVRLSHSIDLFSHVILDDVSVSEFQTDSNTTITCHSDVLMKNSVGFSRVSFIFNDTLVLFESTFLFDRLFVLSDYQTMTGVGTIDTDILNFGKIHPSSAFIFNRTVSLLPSSIISLQINNNISTQLIVDSTAYLDGILELEFDTNSDTTGHYYTLIVSGQINGKFSRIISPCASLTTTYYSKTSLIVSVNDYVFDLNQVSYISTSGIDDPCCGTLNSPCASFKGVIERMGRKGKVYFHEGSYSFNQGLGKVRDVDWKVIGFGDVMIEGIEETLFEIVDSTVIFSNIIVSTFSSISFLFSNSNVSISNSTFQSSYSLFDGYVFSSKLTVMSSSFTSFSVIFTNSEIEVVKTQFDGRTSNLFVSISSTLRMISSNFYNLTANTLFVSTDSLLHFSRSLFSEITANSIFDTNASRLEIIECNSWGSFGSHFVDCVDCDIVLKHVHFNFSNFTEWFTVNSGSFDGQQLTFSQIENDVFIFVNCAEIMLQSVLLSDSNLDAFISSTNSAVSTTNITILNSAVSNLLIGFSSGINLDFLLMSNSVCYSFITLDLSTLQASSIQILSSNYSSNLFSLSNSTVFVNDCLVDGVFSDIFLTSSDSIVLFESTVIKNFNFLRFLDLLQSNVTFFNLSKTECRSSFLNASLHDVIMIESESTFHESILSGCVSDNIFKNSYYLQNSHLSLNNRADYLLLSSLSLIESNCTLYSESQVISKILVIDADSRISGLFVDLSHLSSNISISPSQHCCNTSFCQMSLQLDNAFVLENLMTFRVKESQDFQYFYHSHSLLLSLEHSRSYNSSSSTILVCFVIEQMFFSHQLFIPICPIEFVSLEPPTRGGFVPLFAFNLGLDPIVILESTASINQSLEYSSNNHEIWDIFFLKVLVVIV